MAGDDAVAEGPRLVGTAILQGEDLAVASAEKGDVAIGPAKAAGAPERDVVDGPMVTSPFSAPATARSSPWRIAVPTSPDH